MSLSKHIEELCQAVSQEGDAEKLLELVNQLNRELEHASETRPKVAVPQAAQSGNESAPQSPHVQKNSAGESTAA